MLARLSLYQDIQDLNKRTLVAIDANTGQTTVWQLTPEQFSQIAAAGIAPQRTSGTNFQGTNGGTFDWNRLKQMAAEGTPTSLRPADSGTAIENAFNINQKIKDVDTSKLPTSGGEVVQPGVNDLAALQAQGYTTAGQQIRPAAELQSQFLAAPEGKKLAAEEAARQSAPSQQAQQEAPSVDIQKVLAGDFSSIPKSVTDSSYWKALSDEQKKAVALTYAGLISGNEAQKADASKALEDAKKFADPYYRGLISLAQDELQRSQISTSADATSKISQLQRNISQLNQDLALGREDMDIEERSNLAQLKREYELQLQNTQTQMVEAGLTFSSPRAEAERRLQTSTEEAATSVRRKFAQQQRDLALQSQRGITESQAGITDTERAKTEKLTSAARTAEAKLGTANLPTDTERLGVPVTGTLEKERQAGILDLEKTLLGRTTPLPF